MTWDQYWNQDVTMVRAFREADQLRQQRKNAEAWLQGRYIYDAILCVSPVLHAFAKNGTKPIPYHEQPYPMNEEQAKAEREKQEELERIRANIYMNNMVRAGKNWGKR